MKRHALFVGVDEYADPTIQNLNYPSEDATELASAFKLLLKFNHVEKLLNPAHSADVVDVVKDMTRGLGPGDLFLFFFAGHGFRVKENHVLVCAKDEYADLEDEYAGLAVGQLKKRMRGAWDRMLILDACQNDIRATRGTETGATARDLSLIHELDAEPVAGCGRQILVTSCSEGQKALEVAELKHGLFTYAILDSITSFANDCRRIDIEGLRADLGVRMGQLISRYRLSGHQEPLFTMPANAARIILLNGASEPPPIIPMAVSALVVCPICGKKNEPKETFRCRKCGRDNLCLSHQDTKTRLCPECAAKKARREAASQRTSVEGTPGRKTIDGLNWHYVVKDGKATLGTVYETKSSSRPKEAITVPESLGGYPVIGFGGLAFRDCRSLKSITLPKSVTQIGSLEFAQCDDLVSIKVAKANERYIDIDGVVFSKDGETLITYPTGRKGAFVIPPLCKKIGTAAFMFCNIRSLTIPNGVASIGDYAFSGCIGLTSISIPESVRSIGYDALRNCKGLTSVTIPYSVESIGEGAFNGCRNLISIWVAKDNPCYTDVDGVVFSKDERKLVAFPAGRKDKFDIPVGVASIGDGAFEDCPDLTSVTIPNGVTSIGDHAFSGCSGFKSVTIPNGVTSLGDGAFSGCDGLTSVTIPSGVTSIGDGAFANCSGLKSVTIQDGVTSIGDWAFNGCRSLMSVTMPKSVTSIGYFAFHWCDNLVSFHVSGENTRYSDIDGVVFSKDKRQLAVFPAGKKGDYTIPDSVTRIGGHAFDSCKGLTSVTIPNGVTSIGDGAFEDCPGLTSVTIPNGVISIGIRGFSDCSGLKSVTIPNGVTSIGDYAFSGCSGLKSVTIPNGVTSIGEGAFYNCHGLKSVTIPNGVTSIGKDAFRGCSGLTSVTIPNGVTSIGDLAFAGCRDLRAVTIPKSVTSIGHFAFAGCYNLVSVNIPRSITSMGFKAFDECERLSFFSKMRLKAIWPSCV